MNYVGFDNFQYEITDREGLSSVGEVSIELLYRDSDADGKEDWEAAAPGEDIDTPEEIDDYVKEELVREDDLAEREWSTTDANDLFGGDPPPEAQDIYLVQSPSYEIDDVSGNWSVEGYTGELLISPSRTFTPLSGSGKSALYKLAGDSLASGAMGALTAYGNAKGFGPVSNFVGSATQAYDLYKGFVRYFTRMTELLDLDLENDAFDFDAFDAEIDRNTEQLLGGAAGTNSVVGGFLEYLYIGGARSNLSFTLSNGSYASNGFEHSDRIIMGSDDGYYDAGENDDVIFGMGGDDFLIGGSGDDILYGGEGSDLILGGGDDDRIHGGDGRDDLEGETGNDTLIGGGGDDWLRGGEGNDTTVINANSSTIMGSDLTGAIELISADGVDKIYDDVEVIQFTDISMSYAEVAFAIENRNEEPTGKLVIRGAAVDDETLTIVSTLADADGMGSPSYQWLRDGAEIQGETSKTYSLGADDVGGRISVRVSYIDGRGTAESVTSVQTGVIEARRDIVGTPQAETLAGTAEPELINGLAGNDHIVGGGGSDLLAGRNGDDTVFGDSRVAAYYGTETANQVFRLYQATLGREPDLTGHANWSARIASGARSLLEVAEGFVLSPEFTNALPAKATPETFVRSLYRNVLNNDNPDAQGVARWVGELTAEGDARSSRAEVVLGFCQSPQFISETNNAANLYARESLATNWSDDVFRLYQATLGRDPDLTGQGNWSERLATHDWTLVEVAEAFVGSPEFTNAFPADATPEAFVRLLYRNVLNNDTPDARGLARWVGELTAEGDARSSRAEVVLGFSQSPQFAAHTAAGLKGWMRDQGVDDRIEGGPGNDLMAGGQFADVFVFDANHDGADTVADLEVWDFLDLNGFGYGTAAQVRAEMTQSGDDLIFEDQGVQITLLNTTLAQITDDMIMI